MYLSRVVYCCFSQSSHSKIDENENQNRSIELSPEHEKRKKVTRQTLTNTQVTAFFSYARYAEKFFFPIYGDLHGPAMLVPIRMGTNMAAGNQQKHLSLSFAIKAQNVSLEKLKKLE